MISSLRKTSLFSILFFSIYFNFLSAQNIILSDAAKVSVITCDVGNESYSLFGHTALRISDLPNGIDFVYHYGAFDFSTPNFIAKFSKGDLKYFIVKHSYSDFLNDYIYERRSVYEQELIIPTTLKQKLLNKLNTTLQSNEIYYTYKFIDKNCTTMVVDLLNLILANNVIVKKDNTNKTYRSILYPYFENHFYEKLGTSIIFGTKVDEKATKIFLPKELLENLQITFFNGKLLSKPIQTTLLFSKQTEKTWWNNNYTYLLLLFFILIINIKKLNIFFLSLMGILGLFFTFMGGYSLHLELEYNYNILLFNPLILIFLIIKNKNIKQKLQSILIFTLLVYAVFIFNKPYFSLILPLILVTFILLFRVENFFFKRNFSFSIKK